LKSDFDIRRVTSYKREKTFKDDFHKLN